MWRIGKGAEGAGFGTFSIYSIRVRTDDIGLGELADDEIFEILRFAYFRGLCGHRKGNGDTHANVNTAVVRRETDCHPLERIVD